MPIQTGLPDRQGLYDPKNEHDACGIGFVVNIRGDKSHAIVRQAITILANLAHRGGAGSESNTGDGAGILLQLPDRFFRQVCPNIGIALPEAGAYGVGMVFLPRDEISRKACERKTTTFTGWIHEPRVTQRPFRRAKGRGRKTPRTISGSRPAISVKNMLRYSPELRDQPWVRYRIKDGEKGPMVWEVKHVQITVKDDRKLPGMRLHLIVARNVLDPTEIKFFVSNATPETSVQTMLLAAFSRWHVERCFEDQKQEVGLDQWEGRRWLGLKRHLILTSVSYLFLARVRTKFRGEKTGPDDKPSACGGRSVGAELVALRPSIRRADRGHSETSPPLATTHRRGSRVPHQANSQKTAANGHISKRHHSL